MKQYVASHHPSKGNHCKPFGPRACLPRNSNHTYGHDSVLRGIHLDLAICEQPADQRSLQHHRSVSRFECLREYLRQPRAQDSQRFRDYTRFIWQSSGFLLVDILWPMRCHLVLYQMRPHDAAPIETFGPNPSRIPSTICYQQQGKTIPISTNRVSFLICGFLWG